MRMQSVLTSSEISVSAIADWTRKWYRNGTENLQHEQ